MTALFCPLDKYQHLDNLVRIKKRQPLQRGAKTRATVQLKGILGPPKGLVDTTPKTLHHTDIAERNAQESPLLRLPAELRNRIWTYVLSTHDDITPDAEDQDFK
ncbi:hypothetical protein E8E11_004184 [Didymella keratinophila]|nr:hypothetical protein E8E11_004184 [Didymella keratinophila]